MKPIIFSINKKDSTGIHSMDMGMGTADNSKAPDLMLPPALIPLRMVKIRIRIQTGDDQNHQIQIPVCRNQNQTFDHLDQLIPYSLEFLAFLFLLIFIPYTLK